MQLVFAANRQFNLTAITSPHAAAIKHVLDSVRLIELISEDELILDFGSGAGFPGLPLAACLPEKNFLLLESVRKKAKFLQEAVNTLDIPNVTVHHARVEEFLDRSTQVIDVIVIRAVARITKLLRLLQPVEHTFDRLLLYKGANVEQEIEEAAAVEAEMERQASIALRYSLPEQMGDRSIVEYRS